MFDAISRNADSCVRNRHVQFAVPPFQFLEPDAHDNFTAARELDRIANKIDDYLPEPSWITYDIIGNVARHSIRQFQAFLVSPERKRPHRFFDQLTQAERNALDAKFACFNLREVQNVINDFHQPIR